jgi:hypothetical protein
VFGRPRLGPCRVCSYGPVERSADRGPNGGANAPRRTTAGLVAGIALFVVVVLAEPIGTFLSLTGALDPSPLDPPTRNGPGP